MGEVISAAWRIFGPVVLTWTVKQLNDWWESEGRQVAQASTLGCGCPPVCPIPGNELDPDSGVYFWDLPEQEQ